MAVLHVLPPGSIDTSPDTRLDRIDIFFDAETMSACPGRFIGSIFSYSRVFSDSETVLNWHTFEVEK